MYTYRRAYNNNNNVVVVVAVRGPTMAGKTKGTPINNVNAVQTSPSRAATVSSWATVRCNCVVLWTAKFRATILVVAMDKNLRQPVNEIRKNLESQMKNVRRLQ